MKKIIKSLSITSFDLLNSNSPQFKMAKQMEIGWVVANDVSGGTLAFDLDNINKNKAQDIVRKLIEKERLGNAMLIESSKRHFHCYFFWDYMEWERIMKVIENVKEIDPKFKKFKKQLGILRMRLTRIKEKPTIVKSKYHRKNSHGDFLYNYYLNNIKRLR